MNRRQKISIIVGRVAELLLAVAFLAGAVLKSRDVDLFIVQISYYHVVERQFFLILSALGTLWLETALGIALLFRLRLRGLIFAAALGLLAAFTALIAYAWAFHDLQDCGCFGAIEMSPRVSIVKNGFLMLCCVVAWWGSCRGVLRHSNTEGAGRKSLVVAGVKMLVCVAAAAGCVVYSYSNMEMVDDDAPRPFAAFVFEVDGFQWDLGKGDYFVPMLSMTCEHCMASVSAINDLALEPDCPPIVALCLEDEDGDLEVFRSMTAPFFPLYSLGDRVRMFYLLTDVPPRFYVIRDGVPLHYWDEAPPALGEILEVLAHSSPPLSRRSD